MIGIFLTSRKENCPAFLGAAASGGPSINYENLAVTFSIYAESSQILIVGFVLVYMLRDAKKRGIIRVYC